MSRYFNLYSTPRVVDAAAMRLRTAYAPRLTLWYRVLLHGPHKRSGEGIRHPRP